MLFDLALDSRENRDVYDAMPLEASRMEALYQTWLDSWLDRPGHR